jgi:two-component system, cell cycle sensor histidine kinase and response regulator CckA
MSARKGTILVVDDESESLKLLTDVLSQEGYHVRPADSGKLALASIAVEAPDLILLDVMMPGLDGFDVCRKLKESDKTRAIPVIFLSASNRLEEHIRGFEEGAVDFVMKPFHRQELLARVRTRLELRRLGVELEKKVDERNEALRRANEQLQRELADREQAEEALRESEERFRTMADSASVMICMSGPNRLATFFNQGWLEFTGRNMEQELGYGWTAGVHPDDLNDCLARYSACFDAVPPPKCHLEYRLRRADGEYRSVACNGVPLYEPSGAFAGYIASVVDITDIKRAQEKALANQKLESLGVLSNGIAHDFNNLLGGLIAEAELAEAELAAGAPPSGGIQRIKTIALRASEIVRQLLIYTGQEKGEIGPLDLTQIVEEMLELLKFSTSKHALLKTDLRKDLPAVLGNAPQIRQVVMNLVMNASEAIGEKSGEIRVSTSNAAGGFVRLEISDTGNGMSGEVQSKAFDPFYSTKFAGRGMGLAVVQGIVRDHHGQIKLTSAPGRGTIMEVSLPSATKPTLEATAVPLPRASSTTSTVLLVEDEQTLRFAVSTLLRKKGFKVIEAGDGSTSVELFRLHHHEIDVVLLDLNVPGTPSDEFLAVARQIRPGVKVVLTTAYGREKASRSLQELDVKWFIQKPYHNHDLVQLLGDVLSG